MSAQSQEQSIVDFFLSRFARNEGTAGGNGQVWLHDMRKQAMSLFSERGFPTVKEEDWKHTNLSPLLKVDFKDAEGEAEAGEVESLLADLGFEGEEGVRLVFVNGRFDETRSNTETVPEGVLVSPLSQALKTDKDLIEKHLGRYAGEDENRELAALNTALWEEGAFIHVRSGTTVEKPIHLCFLTVAEEATAVHPRVLAIVEANAQATLLESYAGSENSVYLTNAVTEAVIGENSVVDHYRFQDESRKAFHIGTFQIHQSRTSNFSTHVVSIGSRLARNGIAGVLDGEGVETTLNGLFLTKGDQHVDNHTRLIHAQPHGTSHELFKGILDDESSGAFTGRIIVKPGAQKTDAIQASRNLLLSDRARITPDPQLEIFADDVRCTHGATVGQLDEDAIFYLRSRGLDSDEARGLLTYAFANEIIEKIKIEPLRNRLEGLIADRYRKGRLERSNQ